jgi:hypothetical protein
MSAAIAPWPWWPSSLLLAAAGTIVAAIGIYLIVFRPVLLPEDIRFIGLSTAEVSTIGLRLAPWLSLVFRVLGGYALATGLLTVALSATAFRSRDPTAAIGAALAGASSVGVMAVANFALDSDFKWPLLALALIWMLGLGAFWLEGRTGPHLQFKKENEDETS